MACWLDMAEYGSLTEIWLQAVTVETVQYLLEDTDLPTSPKKRTSRELSGCQHDSHLIVGVVVMAMKMWIIWIKTGTLKNLKKLEQVMDILNKVTEDHQLIIINENYIIIYQNVWYMLKPKTAYRFWRRETRTKNKNFVFLFLQLSRNTDERKQSFRIGCI